MSKTTTWERTPVQNLLRNGESGRYFGRWTVAGKQIWRTLNTDVFSVAKLRLGVEAAKIEARRGRSAAVASGAGTVAGGDLGCLLHLAGRAAVTGVRLTFRHVAEVLADGQPPEPLQAPRPDREPL